MLEITECTKINELFLIPNWGRNLSFYYLILKKVYDLAFVIIEKMYTFLFFIIEKMYLCN